MQRKPTLSINKQPIEKARKFAKSTQRSLSEIIEFYLESSWKPLDEIPDKELEEIIGVIDRREGFSEKEEIRRMFI